MGVSDGASAPINPPTTPTTPVTGARLAGVAGAPRYGGRAGIGRHEPGRVRLVTLPDSLVAYSLAGTGRTVCGQQGL